VYCGGRGEIAAAVAAEGSLDLDPTTPSKP
jgi:hypothetical protein